MAPEIWPENLDGRVIIGVDEVGRGPLAGPVVAAAVILDNEKPILGLNDSKKLTASAREELCHIIQERAVSISIKEMCPITIDRINILQATLCAMREAILACGDGRHVDVVMIDGNRTVPGISHFKQMTVVGGDGQVAAIMAASIVAKVYRDRLMTDLDKEFPGYGFAKHKGYGTREHLDALDKLGPSRIHRMSFAPLKEM